MDSQKIAAALRALADAFEADTPAAAPAETAAAAPVAAAAPRGRGRPPKAAAEPVAPVAAPPAEPDPFETAAPAVLELPPATLDQVRKALTDLKNATDQATALKVLADVGGAPNLTTLAPGKYAAVVAAATKATPVAGAPAAEVDPFETETAAPVKAVTLEEVKAAVVAAQKRTASDTAQKVVMELGGKAAKDGGGYGPSLKALPAENYAAAVKALNELPATK